MLQPGGTIEVNQRLVVLAELLESATSVEQILDRVRLQRNCGVEVSNGLFEASLDRREKTAPVERL